MTFVDKMEIGGILMNMVICLICGNIINGLRRPVKISHLLLYDRKCRTCGKTKNLVEDFIEQGKIGDQLHLHIHMNVKNAPKKESKKVQTSGNILIGRLSRHHSPLKIDILINIF
jgi:hypothetical protein